MNAQANSEAAPYSTVTCGSRAIGGNWQKALLELQGGGAVTLGALVNKADAAEMDARRALGLIMADVRFLQATRPESVEEYVRFMSPNLERLKAKLDAAPQAREEIASLMEQMKGAGGSVGVLPLLIGLALLVGGTITVAAIVTPSKEESLARSRADEWMAKNGFNPDRLTGTLDSLFKFALLGAALFVGYKYVLPMLTKKSGKSGGKKKRRSKRPSFVMT